MNRMKQLINIWKGATSGRPVAKAISVELSAYDYARIKALAEIFSGRTENQILSELVSAALDEVEEAFPYIQGDKVIAEDEFGDPMYADAGLTPRFVELTRKYEASIK